MSQEPYDYSTRKGLHPISWEDFHSICKAQPSEAQQRLDAALLQDTDLAAQTFGVHAYKAHLEEYAAWLKRNDGGDSMKRAREILARLTTDPNTSPPSGDARAY